MSEGHGSERWRQKQAHYRELDIKGNPLDATQRIQYLNAESYGGPLVWSGERYLTAYTDARQDNNYEIYFDLLNHKGERLILPKAMAKPFGGRRHG